MAVLHENLMKITIMALSRLPKTRAWANQTGVARSMDGLRFIKYGLVGSSDILCISNGRMIAVEIKINKDKQREAQINFEKMINSCGGIYVIVRDDRDLKLLIELLS